MEISTSVNSGGTVTIPADIRQIVGIQEGTKVECILNGIRSEEAKDFMLIVLTRRALGRAGVKTCDVVKPPNTKKNYCISA